MNLSTYTRRTRSKESPEKALRRRHREELLDQALADTFPASDPPAMLEPGSDTNNDQEGRARAKG